MVVLVPNDRAKNFKDYALVVPTSKSLHALRGKELTELPTKLTHGGFKTMGKNIKDLFNATAFDKDGDKLGSVSEVFVDDQSGQPTFIEVNHGMFGMSSSLVPLRGHDFNGEDLTLAFSKDRIKDAPDFDGDKALTPEQQQELFRHYGVDEAKDTASYDNGKVEDRRDENLTAGAGAGAGAGVGAGVAGKNAADQQDVDAEKRVAEERAAEKPAADKAPAGADNEVIRSEEQLDVAKEQVKTGEARLRKYTVTENETVEVPVTREEVRVERTPISEEDAANYKGEISDDDSETSVTLHEERVNVDKKTVPVEKVNLNKQQVTETEKHTEELRKEQIDTDGVDPKQQ